jgi:hypothetical protein
MDRGIRGAVSQLPECHSPADDDFRIMNFALNLETTSRIK